MVWKRTMAGAEPLEPERECRSGTGLWTGDAAAAKCGRTELDWLEDPAVSCCKKPSPMHKDADIKDGLDAKSNQGKNLKSQEPK
eukprot:6137769-Heterocapsa_arctica.AAC.1